MRDPHIEEYELKFESSVRVAPSKLSKRVYSSGWRQTGNKFKNWPLDTKEGRSFSKYTKEGRHCRAAKKR